MRFTFLKIFPIICLLLITGCNIRPLYGSLDNRSDIQYHLKRITVEPLSGKAGRHLNKELRFQFNGGKNETEDNKYRLKILLNQNETSLAVKKYADIPHAKTKNLKATYTLYNSEDEKSLITRSAFTNASYDYSTQQFANLRAEDDATKRAANALAEEIYAQIVIYFSSQNP